MYISQAILYIYRKRYCVYIFHTRYYIYFKDDIYISQTMLTDGVIYISQAILADDVICIAQTMLAYIFRRRFLEF